MEYQIQHYGFKEVYDLVEKKFSNSKKLFSVKDVMGIKYKRLKEYGYKRGSKIIHLIEREGSYEGYYGNENRIISSVGRGLIIDEVSINQVRNALKRLCLIGILKRRQFSYIYLFSFERKWKKGDDILLEEVEKEKRNVEIVQVRIDKEELSEVNKRLNKLEEEIKVINQYLKIK